MCVVCFCFWFCLVYFFVWLLGFFGGEGGFFVCCLGSVAVGFVHLFGFLVFFVCLCGFVLF